MEKDEPNKYQDQIIKNLKYLRDKSHMGQKEFGEIIGLDRQQITRLETNRVKNLDNNILIKVSEYFKLDINDIIYKNLEGKDLENLQKAAKKQKYLTGENMRVLTVVTDSTAINEHIILVNEKAAAGYTSESVQDEYIKNLPTFNLPGLTPERSYRAFEVLGDSMLPIINGSIVVGEYIENFNDIKDGDINVVVTKSGQGIILKKTYKRFNENKILLKSSNLSYSPYTIEITDIKEVWKMVRIIAKEVFSEEHSSDSIKEAIFNMQEDIRKIKTKI